MLGQFRIDDFFDCIVATQKLDDRARVVDVPLHSQRKRLDALQNVKGRGWTHTGAEVSQPFLARPHQAPLSVQHTEQYREPDRIAPGGGGAGGGGPL